MSDNKKKVGSPDSKRVNTSESYEVAYWTKKWSISPQQLVGAVKGSGSTSVKEIEKYLKEKGKI
jgi:hypothetical protein